MNPRERGGPRPAVLCLPEIRDYERINAELAQRLDEGHAHVRLTGAEGQRLLASGLAGGWSAVVEIEGSAGPELAAGLDAPGLTVVCRGPAADGAGRGLRAGLLLILGQAGDALGYALEGGAVVAAAGAGARAGLNQRGGTLIVLGAVGALAAERQAGGRFAAIETRLGPHAGRGRRGGQQIGLNADGSSPAGLDPADLAELERARRALERWASLPPGQEPGEGALA
jgi:glutamate synthase domain-containing protein 3